MAALLESGCPQSAVDSCLKNYNVPEPAAENARWLGVCAAVFSDPSLTETKEEKVASLLEGGCPQSAIDSWLKNYNLPATAPAAPAPTTAAAFEGVVKPTKPKVKKTAKGIFAPAVLAAKAAMGEKELNMLRGKVIAEHTKVISAFVETSESKFGQIALKTLFEAADKDGNGTLDKEEVRSALNALGFEWLQEKEVTQIVKRADADENEVIDFEEFVNEAPRTLRVNLVKLAKSNGHDLGFLA